MSRKSKFISTQSPKTNKFIPFNPRGATAVRANRILGRTGKFWAETYFDRYIRDEKHLFNAINYTLRNPVKAGICNDWRDYQFSYLDGEIDGRATFISP